MESIQEMDRSFTIFMNELLSNNENVNLFYNDIANNNFIRGLPIFFCISYIWFRYNSVEKRLCVISCLIGVMTATSISVLVQKYLGPIHVRPFLNPEFHLHLPESLDLAVWKLALNSWPSDTATMYSALSFAILLYNVKMGTIISTWTVCIILVPRIMLGYHFLTDIISGVLLGIGTVYCFQRGSKYLYHINAVRGLFKYDFYCNSIFVVSIWEMGNLMFDVRLVVHWLTMFFWNQ